MSGLEKGIVININVGGLPNVTVSNKKEEPTVPKPIKKDADIDEGDSFDLELINKNRLSDGELTDLGERITLFARRLLKEKKHSVLQEFMSKTKHHLGPDILHLVKNEIEEVKRGL